MSERFRDLYREAVVRRYAEGQSMRHIAAVLDISFGTVRNALVDAGVELRPPGRAPKEQP